MFPINSDLVNEVFDTAGIVPAKASIREISMIAGLIERKTGIRFVRMEMDMGLIFLNSA